MPRTHNIDGVKVPFTAEEETARDAEEVAAAAKKATEDARQEKIDVLKVKITDGSATHAELLEFTQYNIGAK
jgi:anti-sigma28 factor (negative regulator of flagellin synthesis)